MTWLFFEIAWYGWWWALFLPLAFLSGYFFRWFGPLFTILTVSPLLVVIDLRWIFDEMRNHPEDGKDADLYFWVLLIARLLVFNGILTAISFIGWRVKAVSRKTKAKQSLVEDV